MKRFIPFLLVALFMSFYSNSSGQKFEHAGEYMDHFSEQYKLIAKDMWEYTSAVARGKKARKIENKRQDLLKTLRNAELEAKRSPGYEGDVGLRDTLVSYLKLSRIVIDEDYAKIMDMEEIADQSYDMMEAFLLAKQVAKEKLDAASIRMHQEEKRFAAANNVNLLENDDQTVKNLEIASEVFAYYNQIYLIFFKSYKQDLYLSEAIGSANVNNIEQNKNALSSTAKEGLDKLKSIKGYKGSDSSLKKACTDLLNFYAMEADEKVPTITDFYLKQENYEKIKTAFESKKKSKITQEDADQYNNAINEYNEAVNAYNAVNNELNEKRAKLIENWNNAASKFLDRHVPKG